MVKYVLGPHEYYDGVTHRLNIEMNRLVTASGLNGAELSARANMSSSKFSRHLNGRRPWGINDLDVLLRVMDVTVEDHERIMGIRKAMETMTRPTKMYGKLLSDNEVTFWEAACAAPLICIVESGPLLPFPARSRAYQNDVDDLLQIDPAIATRRRQLMEYVAQVILDKGSTLRMLLPHSTLMSTAETHPDEARTIRWGPNWDMRPVMIRQQFQQAMLHSFTLMLWPEDASQDLLFTDEEFSLSYTRDWDLVTRYRGYFDSCWASVPATPTGYGPQDEG